MSGLFLLGSPRLEDKPWGKEEQYKTPLNLGYLIAQISSGVGISSDVVGVTGLEPATSRPPAVRASQLRHTPIPRQLYNFKVFFGP